MFTQTELRAAGHVARTEYETHVGQCYEICHTFGNILIDRGLPASQDAYTVREMRVGPNGEENHFLCVIPGAYTTFADDDVWVDLSLDQFTSENRTAGDVSIVIPDAEPVSIMRPGDDRRGRYMTVAAYLDAELNSE